MTEKTLLDIRITLALIVLAIAMIGFNLSCEKKCPKGEVKVSGKCYVPGVSYLMANGSEKIV